MLKQVAVYLVLAVIFLASSWSLLHSSFFRIHDYVHAARIVEMSKAVQEGHIPPRWSANFGYGYGMPLFEFYAPLPYFAGALLYIAGVPMITTLKILFAGCSLLTMIGAYYLGRKLYGRSSGLVVAAALTLAPYRSVNLFVRGALSEAWGIMALPWILLGIIKVIRNEDKGWLILVSGLVVLMLSHNITTLLFVPLSVIFAVGYWLIWNWSQLSAKESWRNIFSRPKLQQLPLLAGSYLMAIGVSAFYLFPALAEKNFTQVEQIFGGYFHYSHHFLYIRQFLKPFWGYGGSEWGPNDGISFFFGWGQLVGLLIAGMVMGRESLLWLKSKFQNTHSKKSTIQSLGFGAWVFVIALSLMAFACFMSLLRSKFIWDAIPFLAFVQFPWRWLAVAITFLSVAMVSGLASLRFEKVRWGLSALVIVIIIAANWSYFKPESYLDDPTEFYYTDPALIRAQMSSILPDYIPQAMGKLEKPPEVPFLLPLGLDKEVSTLIDRGHEKLYKTTFAHETKLSLSLADFPGWQFEIDGQSAPKVPGDVAGTLAVMVPAGEHLVGVQFGGTPVRNISDIVSALSLVLVLYCLLPVAAQSKDRHAKA
ncbi:MAG TPA: hypothetical protein VD999_04665 [Vitreimonas sp.]|nr:hypothetical protein [Vitreimonas sp.]